MTYPDISTVNATEDLSQLLIYANTVSEGYFGVGILASFYLIILIGGAFANIRFTGKPKIEVMLAVSGFSTFILSVIMYSVDGLLNPIYLPVTFALAIVGFILAAFSSER